MAEFQVYYDETHETWAAWNDVRNGYVGTYDTQKEAINHASGKAQSYADRHQLTAIVSIYQKDGKHKKNRRVDPSV